MNNDDIQLLSMSFLKEVSLKFKRYFFQTFNDDARLFFVIGPRGVGKTTAILQYILEAVERKTTSDKILYVPADHLLVEKIGLYQIAQNFTNEGGQILVLDEIHKYENWSKEIKSIFDTFKKLRVVASGSSSLEVTKGSFDLSRRALVFNMKHMSLREYIELEHQLTLPSFKLEDVLLNHQDISNELIKKIEKEGPKIISIFHKYLKRGCFPFYREYKTLDSYYLAINQMINSSVENDIIAVYPKLSGVSLKRIKKLLNYLASSCPFTPDMTKIKTALSISDERTLKQYFGYLDKLQIIINVEKAGGKLAGLQRPEKIYLNNPNFIYALSSKKEIDIGNLRETFVANIFHGLYDLKVPNKGDFIVDNKYTLEVGGKNKDSSQLRDLKDAYILADDIEFGIKNKIPIWLFGFLY
ncbi:MAG: ATP-binding protein [Oligoflexia bacterium]|nr:ATP-binding protein [Oligoflexia bacterium]